MFNGNILRYPPWLMQPVQPDLEKQPGSRDNQVVIRLNGRLSLETVHNFIQTVRPEPAPHLVLDMGGVSFLDSAGGGALVQIFVHRRNAGKSLALAGLTRQGSAVIKGAGRTNLLPIHASVGETRT